MNADGTSPTQLTFGSDYDANPVFTPDGKQIWFNRTPLGDYPYPFLSLYSGTGWAPDCCVEQPGRIRRT